VKRCRKNVQLVLCVVLGVLSLLSAANVGFCAELRKNQAAESWRWSWFDAQYALERSLSYDATPWFIDPFQRRELTPIPRPGWVEGFGLDENFKIPPHEIFTPNTLDLPTLAATTTLSGEYGALNNPDEAFVETVYRGGNLSNLAIAPYRKRIFVYTSAAWGDQDSQGSNPDLPGFKVSSWGGGVGQDWNIFGHGIIGYGFQGNETNLKPNLSGVYKASLNTFAGYFHLSVFDALWRVDATFGLARNWQKQRLLENGALNSFTTSQWLLDLEFGARFDKGYTRIEPIVNMRILNLNEPRRAERYLTSKKYESGFADASYRLKLGSRFSWEHETLLATLKPYLLVTWSHEFGKREIYTIGDNTPFPVATRFGRHRMARDRIDFGGGVAAAMRETLDLYFQYDVEFAKEYVDYLFTAGLNKKF
jgi:hypothetical protein